MIEHNPHVINYEDVKAYLGNISDNERAKILPEDLREIIETGEMWVLYLYPDTPVGFYIYYAATIERLIELANK